MAEGYWIGCIVGIGIGGRDCHVYRERYTFENCFETIGPFGHGLVVFVVSELRRIVKPKVHKFQNLPRKYCLAVTVVYSKHADRNPPIAASHDMPSPALLQSSRGMVEDSSLSPCYPEQRAVAETESSTRERIVT